MATRVIMPKLGESIVEGTVSQWLVIEGEHITRLAPLLEVSTDKVDTEVPSPATGVVHKIYVAAGETVVIGTLLAVIAEEGEVVSEPLLDDVAETYVTAPPSLAVEPGPIMGSPNEPEETSGLISPVVASLAAEHHVDLSQIEGTGLRGRIRKKDILAYIAAQEASAPRLEQHQDRIVPINRMRMLIAEHMVQSQQIAPHVTTVFDCDMTAVVQHRYAQLGQFARQGVELTFTPYFLSAISAALKEHPYANAMWTEEGINLWGSVHIGLAVAIDGGLVVPVIDDADALDLLELARAVNDLSRRARSGELTPDEIQGGTFTVTNHGTGGSLMATPIINQPQSGILGIGRIHKEPVIVAGGHPLLPDASDTIAIRPIAYLSYSFDHRIQDGAGADDFVNAVKERLQSWASAGSEIEYVKREM